MAKAQVQTTAEKPADEAVDTSEDIRDAWGKIAAGYDEFVTPTHLWFGTCQRL